MIFSRIEKKGLM